LKTEKPDLEVSFLLPKKAQPKLKQHRGIGITLSYLRSYDFGPLLVVYPYAALAFRHKGSFSA
jgi:hypothetical protein